MRIALAFGLGWVPLVIVALLSLRPVFSWFLSYHLFYRAMIAVPVLVGGQIFMESQFRAMLKVLSDPSLLITGPEQVGKSLNAFLELRDSFIAEFILFSGSLSYFLVSLRGHIDKWITWVPDGNLVSAQMTAASWYSWRVSELVSLMLLGTCLWKWLLWTYFVFKLSGDVSQLKSIALESGIQNRARYKARSQSTAEIGALTDCAGSYSTILEMKPIALTTSRMTTMALVVMLPILLATTTRCS